MKLKLGMWRPSSPKTFPVLGRNYLKTGELIEIVFPEYEVYVILLLMMVWIQQEKIMNLPRRTGLMNFTPAIPQKKKFGAVKQAKAQKGERVNGEVPYGYLIDPDNRNHLIPRPGNGARCKTNFCNVCAGRPYV